MWRNQPGETFAFNKRLFWGSASAPKGRNNLQTSDNPSNCDKNKQTGPGIEQHISREAGDDEMRRDETRTLVGSSRAYYPYCSNSKGVQKP